MRGNQELLLGREPHSTGERVASLTDPVMSEALKKRVQRILSSTSAKETLLRYRKKLHLPGVELLARGVAQSQILQMEEEAIKIGDNLADRASEREIDLMADHRFSSLCELLESDEEEVFSFVHLSARYAVLTEDKLGPLGEQIFTGFQQRRVPPLMDEWLLEKWARGEVNSEVSEEMDHFHSQISMGLIRELYEQVGFANTRSARILIADSIARTSLQIHIAKKSLRKYDTEGNVINAESVCGERKDYRRAYPQQPDTRDNVWCEDCLKSKGDLDWQDESMGFAVSEEYSQKLLHAAWSDMSAMKADLLDGVRDTDRRHVTAKLAAAVVEEEISKRDTFLPHALITQEEWAALSQERRVRMVEELIAASYTDKEHIIKRSLGNVSAR